MKTQQFTLILAFLMNLLTFMIIADESDVSDLIENSSYKLGKNDTVKVLVRGKDEFTGEFIVGPYGYIQYPFQGDIKAEGLTKNELKEKIEKILGQTIKKPEVSIHVMKYKSRFIYVVGEVEKPGKYFFDGDEVNLLEAIVSADMPTVDAALKRVKVIRSDNVRPLQQKINLKNILYKGLMKDNLSLQHGDIIYVPSLVHSKFNNFLGKLLDPLTRLAVLDALVERN